MAFMSMACATDCAADWDLTDTNDEHLNLMQLRASSVKGHLQGVKGNDLIARATPDNARNIEFVDRGAGAFNEAGILTSVRFYTQRTGNKGLRFRIFRPS